MNQRRRYEEDFEEDSARGLGRYVSPSTLVGVLAVLGFFALAWYAYKNGSEQLDPSQVELIAAEGGALKEAPQDPGGWQAPHKDKTIYHAFGGSPANGEIAERLTPAPEEPMDVATEAANSATPTVTTSPQPATHKQEVVKAESKTQAWMSSKLQPKDESAIPVTEAERAAGNSDAVVEPEQAVILKDEGAAAATTNESSTIVAASPAAATPVVPLPKEPVQIAEEKLVDKAIAPISPAAAASEATKVVETKAAEAVQSKAAEPVVSKAPELPKSAPQKLVTDVVEEKTTPVMEAKKSDTKVSGGPGKLQLAALKTQAEADAFIRSAKAKAGSALGGAALQTVKADLGEKGTFYRVFATGFADKAAAQKACAALKTKNLDCMVK